ncbi:hypothetical protein ACFVWG_26705 [Kribbella sp. NPDC058245]|uniref:hypothetical protein n=1 Tax=Kribbella sp. NPDC058245 TaxID=3346399 RepID=UPI0036E35B3C
MSQNTPEFTRPQLRRLNREYRRAGRQGTKDAKAAFAMARKNVKNMDPALREGIGRANLTVSDLSAMAQRSVSGVHSDRDRAQLAALGQAAQGRGTGPRNQSTSLVGMLSNSVSRWNDLRRGTKMLKAAYAQAAKDAKTMDPMVRAQIGHSNMTRGDLSYLAQRNLTQALQSPGDFESAPGQQMDLGPQRESFMPRNQVEYAPAQAQRLEMLRGEVRQLREQIANLEQQIAQLEAAEPQPQAETQSPELQSTEGQSAESPEAQSAETQQPEAQSPDAQSAETPQPEAQSAEAQSAEQHVGQHEVVPADREVAQQWVAAAAGETPQPVPQASEAQSPVVQQPDSEQHVGQHEAVPTDREAAQQWVAAAEGETPQAAPQSAETQQPAAQQAGPESAVQEGGTPQTGVPESGQQQPQGTAQPVFQAAGEAPTTRPGQPAQPRVEQPVFQAAGEEPNQADRKAQATRAAAAAFYGTAEVQRSTPEQAAKTAQSDPNKADRSTGQTNAQKNDPNGRGSR